MEDSHWYLRYGRQMLETSHETVIKQNKLHLWSVKDEMDILHELLEIKDIVEGPAKGGAGEGEPHGVEGAVQDDPVHLKIYNVANLKKKR